MNTQKRDRPQKRLTKRELVEALLKKLENWQSQGIPPNEAVEKLTARQYDFLIDQGVNLDSLILTGEQQEAITKIAKTPRKTKPNGYDKKYPKDKIELYSEIIGFLKTKGATISPRDKENYRDIDFAIGETAYKIVLSNPRIKKT